jgi:site-specific DNA recombinase
MKVAIYARVSSESQQARGSIGSQLEVLRTRIAGQGDELVAEFCDDGYSGARLDRPGLDALRDQAEAGAFDTVWCLSPDRLARAYVYQVVVLDELAAFGVRVLFHDAPVINDDPQARLLTQMQGVIAEYERAKICERNRRGRLWRSRAGEVVSWKVPYGYRRVPRDAKTLAHLEVFEPEAAVVRRIFDEYVTGGRSIRQIMRGLNAELIPTPTGKTVWWHSTLCRILRNEAYIGRLYFNQTEQLPAPAGTGRRPTVQRRRPRDEWIAIPCPAIIEDTVFEAARNVSRDNSQWSPRNLPDDVEAWLLRGLLRCGACDGKLNCQKMTTPYGKTYRYYWCRNHASTGAPDQRRCTERNVRADTLDAFAFDQIRAALTRPDLLHAGQSAVTATTPAPDDELLATELARLDRKLEANKAERRRVADLYQTGLLDLADIQRRAHDIDTRHHTLTEQRDALTAQRQQLASDNRLRERVSDFATRVAAGIDTLTFHQRQQLLRLVIDHVTVTGWQVEIQLRIPLDDRPDGEGAGSDDHPRGGGPDGRPRRGPVAPPANPTPGADTVSNKDGLRSIRRRAVAEVGGQGRHAGGNVNAGAIPLDQRDHDQPVTEVMDARPARTRTGLEASDFQEVSEGRVDVHLQQTGAGGGDEERRCLGPWPVLIAQPGVGDERVHRALMQRQLASVTELGVAHQQTPL